MKNLAKICWITIGALLALDAVAVALTTSIHSGIIATFAIGALFLFCGLYHERIRSRTRKDPLKWVQIFAVLVSVLMIPVLALIAAFGRVDTVSYQEDAVVVLGAGLRGEEVTPSLRSRLDAAVGYSDANPDAVIVVSGGQGYGESITEALAMERYLLKRGVSKDRIVKESKSTSTYENFEFTKSLLDEHFDGAYTTAFITNDYHVFRAHEISEAAGMDSTYMHADTPWYQVPVSYTREFMAIVKRSVSGR